MPINRIFKITNIFNTFKIKALFKVLYICKGLLYKYFGVLATRTEAFKSLSQIWEGADIRWYQQGWEKIQQEDGKLREKHEHQCKSKSAKESNFLLVRIWLLHSIANLLKINLAGVMKLFTAGRKLVPSKCSSQILPLYSPQCSAPCQGRISYNFNIEERSSLILVKF